MSINPNGPQMMTTMKDFLILSKIGKYSISSFIQTLLYKRKNSHCLGDGAYSEVYKVRRASDGQVYALKKVRSLNHLITQLHITI